MRVQARQHATDSIFQQGFIVDVFDIVAANMIEYVGKCSQLLERQLAFRVFVSFCVGAQCCQQQPGK